MAGRAWLIYDEVGIQRNKWFAGHLQEVAAEKECKLELKVLPTDGREWWQLETEERAQRLQILTDAWKQEPKPDFVIGRAIAPELTELLETWGIRVFNNAETARIANDKWLTYEKLKDWGIPVLETCCVSSLQLDCRETGEEPEQNPAESMIFKPEYPLVFKVVAGHGGSQVYLAENREQQEAVLQQFKQQGIPLSQVIAQPLCDEPGVDMRVYVLGGEVYEAVLRSCDKDFRSNYSLGGTIEKATVIAQQRAVIERLYDELHFDFVGVDFIRHRGQWVCNEIEDVVGTRMLYQLTPKDAAADYLCYILGQIS